MRRLKQDLKHLRSFHRDSKCKHVCYFCFVAREGSLWELEENHLRSLHQLQRRQLKDRLVLQRHQILAKHEKVSLINQSNKQSFVIQPIINQPKVFNQPVKLASHSVSQAISKTLIFLTEIMRQLWIP